jgi:hypothetical protein
MLLPLWRTKCNEYSSIKGVFHFNNLMEFLLILEALAIGHLLMPAALTFLDYHHNGMSVAKIKEK